MYVVRGNADKEWAQTLPVCAEFSLAGVRFLLIHNKQELPENPGDAQIVIYGHSHRYAREDRDGRLWLNPGSCGRRRFYQNITMALLTLEGPERSDWKVERIEIPHEIAAGREKDGTENEVYRRKKISVNPGTKKDVLRTVEAILKRMDRGQDVLQAAKELRLDPEYVEDVYRMKVTHPGITAREILNKIEIKETGR